ncbi:MAG: YbaK/EbsC family protein [Rhodospirillales bacterium]|nr:YbaK/EbsC family protein [Rhodospirillales bacterium]
MADPLAHPAVRRVQAALAEAGSQAEVIALASTARSAEDAAASIGTPLGSIVKSLVFTVAGAPVMALVAGDRRCDAAALGRVLGREGKVRRADADAVRAATGFSIGGVAPLAHESPLPVAIDASLGRFETVYAAAGHPHCVFATSIDELQRLTGGTVTPEIAASQ